MRPVVALCHYPRFSIYCACHGEHRSERACYVGNVRSPICVLVCVIDISLFKDTMSCNKVATRYHYY